MAIFLVGLGALLLYVGGEALVRSAVQLARIWGMSPLLIGLTVVAFGTSSPELAATVIAALHGQGDIAIGNVIGSNTANLGLILGTSALIFPIAAQAQFIRREVPIMLFSSALVPLAVSAGTVGRLQGILLMTLLVPYLWSLLAGREKRQVEDVYNAEYGAAPRPVWRALAGSALGIALLVCGAAALIDGAASLARSLGVSERVIGVTLVALGTSLPELAAALVAALRREADIVIGNLVGSNIFNVLAVLGAAAAIQPITVAPESLRLDLAVMMLFSAAVLPFLILRQRLGRAAGALLLGGYLAYVIALYV